MNFFWIYDIPNWLFLIICIATFVGFTLLGALIFRTFFERWLGVTSSHNEIIGNFLSVSGLFYGITLGLIAVGTFESFKEAEKLVSEEASALNGLYRDVNMLSKPEKTEMKALLKNYAQYMAGEGWRLQQKGEIPKGTSKIINGLEEKLAAYSVETEKDQIVFAEIVTQNNKLSEKRRLRVNVVQNGLPVAVWHVLFIGAFVIIILTWLLVIKNKKLDILVNTLCGTLLGTLIFLIAAMDYPFRGEFSVTPQPFQSLLEGVMKE